MNDRPVADVVTLLTALAAAFFSAEVAHLVGPYMVIVGGAVFGASFSLVRREKTGRFGAIWFMSRVVGLAVLFTVSIAQLVNAYRPEWPVRLLLAPIAALVGFIGDEWPTYFGKALRAGFAIFDLVRAKGGNT